MENKLFRFRGVWFVNSTPFPTLKAAAQAAFLLVNQPTKTNEENTP